MIILTMTLVPPFYLKFFMDSFQEFKDFSILSWNVRGASNDKAKRHIKELIKKHKPTMFFVLETHVLFEKVQLFWQKVGYYPMHVIEAQGHSGGIWALAQVGHNFNISIWEFTNQAISLEMKFGNCTWICTAIYASPTPSSRETFWQHLCNLSRNITSPWLLIGDWNEILLSGEQKGCFFSHNRAESFGRALDHCGLLDIHSLGGRFTWHRTHGCKHMAKKLNRALANIQWRLSFPEAFVEVLCRLHSDHNPLLLKLGGTPQPRGPKQFRFEAAWAMHEDYQGIVQTAWEQKRGKPLEALDQVRIQSLIFSKDVFDDIFRRKRNIEAWLKGIQKTLERVDSLFLLHLEQSLQHDYNHILFQEELFWFQKSREKWVKLGDKNTAFFHAQTIIRRKRNKVHGLNLPSGIWCTDEVVL